MDELAARINDYEMRKKFFWSWLSEKEVTTKGLTASVKPLKNKMDVLQHENWPLQKINENSMDSRDEREIVVEKVRGDWWKLSLRLFWDYFVYPKGSSEEML